MRSVRVLGLLMGIILLMALLSGKPMTPVMNWRAFSIGIVTYGVGVEFCRDYSGLRVYVKDPSSVEEVGDVARRVALMSALAVGLVGLSGCGDSRGEVSPSPSIKVTSSADVRSACQDTSVMSRAEKLTTSNVDSLKGHKAWGCVIGGEDDGEVLQFESFARSDVDSMRKSPDHG